MAKVSARAMRKKKMIRIIAICACAALLISTVMSYIAFAIY